ncbi:MAG: hypothetical protein SV186_01300 [Candidatus Nanohaloarchaea archaeon]|nr:hypothetical protein [Candidatus Nanohaloarchaea archaeon]
MNSRTFMMILMVAAALIFGTIIGVAFFNAADSAEACDLFMSVLGPIRGILSGMGHTIRCPFG